MTGNRKLTGCCTLCDEEIFTVVSRFTEGPYHGEIKEVGQPLPGAKRLTMVRASGNQSNLSLCAKCQVTPEDMPAIHRKEIAAMVKEREIAIDTMEQLEWKAKLLRLFEWDIPIGVLGEMPWAEVR